VGSLDSLKYVTVQSDFAEASSLRLKRWQLILIIVCAVLLIGGLTAVMLLRDTGELSSREVEYMVKVSLQEATYHYTTLDTKYIGNGRWELRTTLGVVSEYKVVWKPVVITFDEKLGKILWIEPIHSE